MSNFVGTEGVVKVGNTAVGSLQSFSLTLTGDQAENTSMGGDGWRTMLATLKSWSGTVNLFFDQADATQALLLPNALLTLELLPEGDTSGDYSATGTAFISGIDQTSGLEDVTSRDVTFVGSGALTISTVS